MCGGAGLCLLVYSVPAFHRRAGGLSGGIPGRVLSSLHNPAKLVRPWRHALLPHSATSAGIYSGDGSSDASAESDGSSGQASDSSGSGDQLADGNDGSSGDQARASSAAGGAERGTDSGDSDAKAAAAAGGGGNDDGSAASTAGDVAAATAAGQAPEQHPRRPPAAKQRKGKPRKASPWKQLPKGAAAAAVKRYPKNATVDMRTCLKEWHEDKPFTTDDFMHARPARCGARQTETHHADLAAAPMSDPLVCS